MKQVIFRAWSSLCNSVKPPSSGLPFLALAVWMSVLGTLWLEQSALQRRKLERRVTQLELESRREWRMNAWLERWAAALHNDPAAIEAEARRLGYGRPGEQPYPLSEKDLKAVRVRLDRPQDYDDFAWTRTLAGAMAPALMVLLSGAIAVLFFVNLKVEDHLDSPEPPVSEKPGEAA